jgi:3-deoxy-7-phosphoheptulonate synthase
MPSDLHVVETQPLVTPRRLMEELPLSSKAARTVETAREAIRRIMYRQDNRLLAVVGPCSIHDVVAAKDYASRLVLLADQYSDRLLIVMRAYVEKPRTTVGWRGLISDPLMDMSDDGEEGLRRARQLFIELNEMGLPVATEMLDPIAPQYIAELVAWTAIGARTTESPTHRALASGLSMPVGFKNGTDGDIQVAANAMIAAQQSQSFLGIDLDGRSSVVHTTGNPDGILVLRGGRYGPNYDAVSIQEAADELDRQGLPNGVMVDYSHVNSNGDPRQQEFVWRESIGQLSRTRGHQIGFMAESFLKEGKQPLKLPTDPSKLEYGLSVTDACMSWGATERMLGYTYDQLG